MNVDTGEFRALTDQVGALGRKVSALTGRVTVMGHQVNRLDGSVEDDLRVLIRAVGHLAGVDGPAPEHAAPGTDRPALTLIRGGSGR